MKRVLILIAFLCLAVPAQARVYNQAELDALIAPIALYPDSLLSQILMAATYPEEVAEAARWARANPHLKGDEAVRAAQNEPWDPSVKSLLAFPEVLARMDESPRWTRNLGEAFLNQEPHVMDTVQALRRRAQANGNLSSNDQYAVEQQGQAIVVQPRTQYVYVPHYDPYVVYGPWWWHAYRPVYWRPWYAPPVFVSSVFFGGFNWHQRHVTVVRRPIFVQQTQVHVVPGKWQHRASQSGSATVREYHLVPESRRQPIVNGMPAATGFSHQQSVPRSAPLREVGREVREHDRAPVRPQARPAAPSTSAPRNVGREVHRVEQRREPPRAAPRRIISKEVQHHRGSRS